VILVTVGNANQPFTRLLAAVDDLAVSGYFEDERLLMQVGTSRFRTVRAECHDFIAMDEFSSAVREATLIITHGGCGTLLECVRAGKPVVAMARRKTFGEHVNDHQVQIVREFQRLGLAASCEASEELKDAIERARTLTPAIPIKDVPMVQLVAEAIERFGRR
jgi:UDP-N-acetylglucosamine transferase subunit ALG13